MAYRRLSVKGKHLGIGVSLAYTALWLLPLLLFSYRFVGGGQLLSSGRLRGMLQGMLPFLSHSLSQAVLSVLFSFVIALPVAWYVGFRRGLLARILESLIFIPFFFPAISLVVAFGYLWSFDVLRPLSYTLTAILVANVFYNAPLFVSYMGQGIRAIGASTIEAASSEGLSTWHLLRHIVLPLVWPHILRAAYIVFSYSFTSLIIVLSLGGLNYATLEVEISHALRGSANFEKALILGLVQWVVLFALHSLVSWRSRHANGAVPKDADSMQTGSLSARLYATRKYVPVGFVLCALSFLCFEGGLVLLSFVQGMHNPLNGAWNLKGWQKLFDGSLPFPVWQSCVNTLMLAALVALVATLIAYVLARIERAWSSHVVMPMIGFSSGFLGILLLYVHIRLDVPLFWLLVAGYVLVTVPIAYSFLLPHVKTFPLAVLEAGSLDGLAPLGRFLHLELPLLKPVFVSVGLQIFAIGLAEFSIVYTMQARRIFPTLSVVQYSMLSRKFFAEAAALSTMSLLFVMLVFYLATRYAQKRTW